ncbi:MAG: hypothetical protein Q8O23_00330, partial [Gallionella sp.]|nr:hypothetical protein [Gallionella sp.]
MTPLSVNQPPEKTDLPVAAMPHSDGEVWAAYRAKKRPCLVIGSNNPAVDQALTQGMPTNSTAPTVLVAPYYGVDKDSRRAGYQPDFVERVRHCEYPQFVWDRLPIGGGPDESILRLDHLQPIGALNNSYKLSEFKLSDAALEIIRSGIGRDVMHQLRAEGLHHGMLPLLDTILDDPTGERFITAALKATDARIVQDKTASPAYLFGALLWPQVVQRWKALEAAGEKSQPALFFAM